MKMANSSSKSPGRTPPFVLVALVLLVVILGYNYWMLSSSNRTLGELNDKMAMEAKDNNEKRLIAEKNGETAKEELRVLQGNLDTAKKNLDQANQELENLRSANAKNEEESNKYKEQMGKCDSELNTQKEAVNTLTAEKQQLETALAAAKDVKPPECNADNCIKPMKDVVIIASRLVGTDAMDQALKDAKLDSAKLMEGTEKIAAPAPAAQNTGGKQNQVQYSEEELIKKGGNKSFSSSSVAPQTSTSTENLVFHSETEVGVGGGNSPVDKTLPDDRSMDQPEAKKEDENETVTDSSPRSLEQRNVTAQATSTSNALHDSESDQGEKNL